MRPRYALTRCYALLAVFTAAPILAQGPLFAPPQTGQPGMIVPLPPVEPVAASQPAYSGLVAPSNAPQPVAAAIVPPSAPDPPPVAPAEAAVEMAESVEEVVRVEEVIADDPIGAPGEADVEIPEVPEGEVSWYTPSYWFGPTPWDSGFELGLNGASGTSESLSFRTGGFIKRTNDDYKFDASLYYNKTQSEGVEVQSNALLDVRYDWLFEDSPWTLFLLSQTFYDEFQAFDINVNANSGVGYQWIDTDRTKLTTSIGSGASREFGGSDDEWVPEASFGVNYELKIYENKKFYAKVDYFPEWEDFNRYRVLADVGLEIELHQPSNVSLKFSATDRYDSMPDGVEPHNLNYSALLIWKL